MPDEQTVLYSLLGVALILIAVVYYSNLRAKHEAAEGPQAPPGQEESPDEYMLKFVRHEGSVVGETVAHEGDTLILKQAGVFKAVPIAQAEVEDDEIVLEGDIDWDAAVDAGTAWRETHTKGSDPTVSGDLTRSEDVQKPALDALKDKEREAAARSGVQGSETAARPGSQESQVSGRDAGEDEEPEDDAGEEKTSARPEAGSGEEE